MAAYDNLLFIGASRQRFHQLPLRLRPHAAAGPKHAASCQTRRHRQASVEITHTCEHPQLHRGQKNNLFSSTVIHTTR